jgi:hypothetical protein
MKLASAKALLEKLAEKIGAAELLGQDEVDELEVAQQLDDEAREALARAIEKAGG